MEYCAITSRSRTECHLRSMFEKMDSLGCLVVFFVLVAWCFAGFVFGCLCGFVLIGGPFLHTCACQGTRRCTVLE